MPAALIVVRVCQHAHVYQHERSLNSRHAVVALQQQPQQPQQQLQQTQTTNGTQGGGRGGGSAGGGGGGGGASAGGRPAAPASQKAPDLQNDTNAKVTQNGASAETGGDRDAPSLRAKLANQGKAPGHQGNPPQAPAPGAPARAGAARGGAAGGGSRGGRDRN
jgi:hypothetical protein